LGLKSFHFLSREMDESAGASEMPAPRQESRALPEIIAELARGTPAVALMSNMPQGERTSLLNHLRNYLEGEKIRTIAVDGVDGETVGVRRFCELLVAASSPSSDIRDAAEHLATIFTAPQAGERGLLLVIENADALSAEAIAFAKRLATASEARALSVQLLLFGSRALEFRLPEAGSFAVRQVPSRAAAPDRSVIRTARRSWTGHGLAAVGGVAVLFFFLAAASGDREQRRRVPEEATAAPVVPPARAALPVAPSDRDNASAATSPAEPARTARPVALAERETIPAPEHHAEAVPARPPSDQAEAAGARARPARAESPVDAPAPVSATPPPDFPRQDAAAQPSAESGAAQGSTPTPPPTAIAEPVPASQPVPQATPAAPPVATTDVASQPSTAHPSTTQPSTAQPEATAPTAANAAETPAAALVPAATPVPTAATEQMAVSQPSTPAAPPAAMTDAPPPPATVPPGTVAPRAADAASVAPPATAPTPTEQALASQPPVPSAPPMSPVGTTDAASPPAAAPPGGVVPRSADVSPSAAAPALAPAIQQPPPAKPSPAATALLTRGDELIAIGDVATARIVYERAAGLKSGRGATSTGRTYDPRFLRQIGAVGVVPDPEAAASWYRKGAAMGDETAASLLGDLGSSKASQ